MTIMKNYLLIAAAILLLGACGKKSPAGTSDGAQPESMFKTKTESDQMISEGRGIGEIKTVEMTTPLDQERIKRGKAIYDMKCSACHKLTDERLVGPGWQGVTKNRKPEWIMNMITNTDAMLEQDPEAQKLLELCLTRMPNQSVAIGDARDILEFMRQNDGEK